MTPLHDDQAEPPGDGCPAWNILFAVLLALLVALLAYAALALQELPPLPNDGVRQQNGLDQPAGYRPGHA